MNGLATRRTSTVLDVTIETGPIDVEPNANSGTESVDDLGGRSPAVPPSASDGLRVPKNSASEGELVFAGRLNPAARRGASPSSPTSGAAPPTAA